MKYPCGLIRDLLPLYHDTVCGEESKQAVQEHFEECIECKNYYQKMCQADVVESYAYDEALEQKKAESLKQVQKKMKKKNRYTILIVVGILIVYTLIRIVVPIGAFGLLIYGSATSKVEEYTDISAYESYIGENANEQFRSKWGMDEEIFPESITEKMQVEDFKMVYYNPWDAQYLSYLTVVYDKEAYQEEMKRLEKISSTEYLGNYRVTGPPQGYSLVAMNADDYQGFIYAITDNKDTIIYVELIFCNYFMDLEYTKYIPEEYLLEGFDATQDNPYKKEQLSK